MIRISHAIAAVHRELGIPPDYAITRRLEYHADADGRSLVPVRAMGGREIHVSGEIIDAWTRMQTTAATDSVQLILVSGFRSFARQTEIIRRKLRDGADITTILKVNAAPGFSEHHTGRAIDIATVGSPPLETEFGQTAAFQWLCERAGSFGFTLSYPADNLYGIAYEPWHWCWHPAGIQPA